MGWLVMNIEGVREGLIMVKIETWHPDSGNKATDGWEEINNGVDGRKRYLKSEALDYCKEFQFQYAIDGKVTTLSKDEFLKKMKTVAHNVEILTIMDDEGMAQKGEERDIELGIRLLGCKREKT